MAVSHTYFVMPPKPSSKKSMAADPGTPAPGPSAVARESGGGPGYSSTMLDDFRRIVREVIRDEIAMLRSEIQSAIAPIKAALSECSEKVREVEGSMNVFDARLAGVESACNLLASENNKLLAKIDDLENRSRRNNLRVVGIPEGMEEGRPTEFMSSFFQEVFGQECLDSPPVLDRAHRSSAARPREGERPRPFILRVHHFQVKERLLRLSREKGQLIFRGKRVFIFPDFSADLVKRRAAYNEVRALLRGAKVRYGLLHPARLRVSFNGTDQIFDTPEAARDFYSREILPKLKCTE